MADKKPADERPNESGSGAETAAPATAKKKLPIKTIGVVVAVMGIEAAALFVVFGMMGPKASQAQTDPEQLHHDDSEQTTEIELADDKFQNMQSGRVWLWDISVVLQVKNKNAEAVSGVLERRSAEIREGLSQIISRAQQTQLKEPERQTLIRQIAAYLERVDGITIDDKPLFERVIIPKCRGFPTDL